MDLFRRRVFYDANGVVLESSMADGALRSDYSQEMEANDNGISGWNCIEWTEPDSEVEAAFAEVDSDGNPRNVKVSVDISGLEPKLVFTYEPIEDIITVYSDIIDVLTGEQ